jgi:type IV secretion system protein VirB4
LQTTNGQPYYFNFHATHPGENSLGEKAIANTMVIGKSGTGKTALINFLLSQVQKLKPSPTIFFFDKDRGAEIFVRACGATTSRWRMAGHPASTRSIASARSQRAVPRRSHQGAGQASRATARAKRTRSSARSRSMLDTPMHLRSLTNFQKSLPNMGDDGLSCAPAQVDRRQFAGMGVRQPGGHH